MCKLKLQKIAGNLTGMERSFGNFSPPQATENLRQHLLLRTVTLAAGSVFKTRIPISLPLVFPALNTQISQVFLKFMRVTYYLIS